MLFTVAPPVCVVINSTTKIVRHTAHLPFTENSRSIYVNFEKHGKTTGNKDEEDAKSPPLKCQIGKRMG